MTLLNLCFDIDAEKYNEANAKIDNLLASANPVLKIPALEQKIRMQQKRASISMISKPSSMSRKTKSILSILLFMAVLVIDQIIKVSVKTDQR